MLRWFTPLSLLTLSVLFNLSTAFIVSGAFIEERSLSKRSILNCPYGWYHDKVGEMCYKTFNTPMDRDSATRECDKTGYGAKLAITTDYAMRDGLMRYVRDYKAKENDICLCEFREVCFLTGEEAINGCPELTTNAYNRATTTIETTRGKIRRTTINEAQKRLSSKTDTLANTLTNTVTNGGSNSGTSSGMTTRNTSELTDATIDTEQNTAEWSASTPPHCNSTEPWCVSIHQRGMLDEDDEYYWTDIQAMQHSHSCDQKRCFICQVKPHEDWGDVAWSSGKAIKDGAVAGGKAVADGASYGAEVVAEKAKDIWYWMESWFSR